MFEKDAQSYAFDEVNHKQQWYIKHPIKRFLLK